ncbi:MAG: rhomboid family intramembrane serine protease [Clostridiales bacterium]|nr:rhomboid family intramembrane serine protease [Clostridiales bacterium]
MIKTALEKILKVIKDMKCSMILSIIFIAVFIIDQITDGVLTKFGSASKYLFDNKEFWRLLTSTYLHGNVLHLLGNIAGLLLIGYTVEKRYGISLFLLFFLVPEFLTNMTQWLITGINVSGAVGASCGIYGLLAALVITLHRDIKNTVKEFRSAFGIIRALGILVYVGFSFGSVFNLFGHALGFAFGTFVVTVYFLICFFREQRKERAEDIYG